jgi:hypothetical protein
MIHTNLSFVRISLTDDNCLVICAISASDFDNDINNRSRFGLRYSGPLIGVVLRARRLD